MKKNLIRAKIKEGKGEMKVFINFILKTFPAGSRASGKKTTVFTPPAGFLPQKTRQKSCRIKLNAEFAKYSSHLARLINNSACGRVVSDKAFPQTGHFSDSGNYIKRYQQSRKTNKLVLLKKLPKLTDQSGSKFTTIPAEKNYISLFLRRYFHQFNISPPMQLDKLLHRRTIRQKFLTRTKNSFRDNNPQKKSNQNQRESNQGTGVDIPNIDHNFLFDNFLNSKAIPKQNIPAIKSAVKRINLNGMSIPEKLGTTNTVPNQPAARLIDNSDVIENQSLSSLTINSIYHHPCN